MTPRTFILPVLLFILCFTGPAAAAILEVPAGHATIQAALDASAGGDTVRVARGIWAEHLVGPTHSVSLLSHYPFTGDTLDVQETVLDGQGSGTILRVRGLLPDSLVLCGFTLAHGFGVGYTGGALHLEPDVALHVSHCHFEDNQGDHNGAVLRTEGVLPNTRVRLDHVTLHNNARSEQLDPINFGIYIKTVEPVWISDLSVLAIDSGFNAGISVTRADTLTLKRVRVSGAHGFRIGVSNGNVLLIDSLVVRDMRVGATYLRAAQVQAKHLHFLGLEMWGPTSISLWGDSSITVDSLAVRGCWTHVPYSTISNEFNLLVVGCINATSTHHSRLSHFEFVDNLGGDTLAIPGHNMITALFSIQNARIEDGRIAGNVMHLWAATPTSMAAANYPLMRLQYYSDLDSARVTRCVFENNLVLDHDFYSLNPTNSQPNNDGRSLGVIVNGNAQRHVRRLEIDHLLFRNERQPNHVPEVSAIMTESVGSAFEVVAPSSLVEMIHIHDIVMDGIDDGGMYLGLGATTNVVERVTLRDVKRMGIFAGQTQAQDHQIRNIFVDGVVEQDMYLSYPYAWSMQSALLITDAFVTSNITVVNSNLTNLLCTYGPSTGILTANNTYSYFNNPSGAIYGNPSFAYSFADQTLPGTGNLTGSDPHFDNLLGAPWLAADSPCIDAGHPASALRDRQDPDNPGFALWPSQGTRRNDMGFTGGPGAAVLDTAWAVLPRWEPRTQPQAFTLGAPWPNPFNPVTRIPLTLQHPMPVRLVVHNLLGQQVAVLVDGILPAGTHHLPFQAGRLASGLYLVTLEAAGRAQTRTVTLLR
jgi:hypothetical protein